MSKPLEVLERIRAWQPVAYLMFRAAVYAVMFTLSATLVWYGGDPHPEWLDRALAVSSFLGGPMALVNLSRPRKVAA